MHVLHVLSGIDPINGGPVNALKGLAQAQLQKGMKVSVVSTWCRGTSKALAEELRQRGCAVHLIGPAISRLGSWHPAIGKVLRVQMADADIVHIHALWEQIHHRAAMTARNAGKPYIMRPCGMLDPWSLNQRSLKKRLYMRWRIRRDLDAASALHFTAIAERDGAARLGLAAPVIVEPNGVDLAEFQSLPAPGTFRNSYPEIGQHPIVLFLSRLHPKKGLELLVPAFAKAFPATGTDVESSPVLVIAGPDSDGYQARVKAMVAACGLAGRTFFPGMLHGQLKVAALAEADLFVLPSHQENFGIAVIEALAAGTPVVISDQVAIHPEITSAEVGAAVRLDVDELARTLAAWMNNRQQRDAAAAKARPFVWENYDWAVIAQRWANRYAELVSAHRGRS